MAKGIFELYLSSITSALKRGDATEHTHRPALKSLIESFTKGITATNEPKHSCIQFMKRKIQPDFTNE